MRREQRSGQTGRDARRRDRFGGETMVKRASWYPRRKRGTKVSLLSATHYTWATRSLLYSSPRIHHARPSFTANLASKLLHDSHPASRILYTTSSKKNFCSKLFQRVHSFVRSFILRVDLYRERLDAWNKARSNVAFSTYHSRYRVFVKRERGREKENAITSRNLVFARTISRSCLWLVGGRYAVGISPSIV